MVGRVANVAPMTMEDAPLRVEHRPEGVVLIGEIDAHSAGLVGDALVPIADGADLRVDLSGVTFVDSSGLRIVLKAHQTLDGDGRRLVLVNPSRPVIRLIELAGLVNHLHIEPPLDSTGPTQLAAGADR